MTTYTFSGGDKLKEALDKIAERMRGEVSVGFQTQATYPDNTPVAAVAYWNEFGVPSNNQPPRPFFRLMIAKESPTWGKKLAGLAKATNYNGAQTLGLIGQDIGGALKQSINELVTPPLSPRTIAAKGFDKPLIETSQMINSITSKVNDNPAESIA